MAFVSAEDQLEDTIELLDSAGIPPGPLAWRVREYALQQQESAPPIRLAGGSAFPLSTPMANDRPGMSLREHFAGKALEGDWASQNADTGWFQSDVSNEQLETRASLYYRMADAMIKERNKLPITKQEKNNVTGS